MAGVRFEHVTKSYGKVVAVRDLNLDILDREFVALVGPSGCGKTTVLRLLAGLEEVEEGAIYIGDRLVNNVTPRDRDVAMVFQSYALYPHMTVFDNMAFGLSLRKMPRPEIERRVNQAASTLGIKELLKRRPRQLSGGQRQRVALGRAIVREPAAFLLDEPLSNLDAKLRIQTRAEISRLHRKLGGTFIYVTHDQVEAMTMADRIAALDHGVLQQVGTPEELYERPVNLFVAGFIGSPAMNFFQVKVVAGSEGIELDAGAFRLPVPPDRAGALAERKDQTVTLGIRPEVIHDSLFVPYGLALTKVKARVDVAEMLGNEVLLHLVAGDISFLARADSRTRASPGQEMEAAFNMEKMHLFDLESGKAVR